MSTAAPQRHFRDRMVQRYEQSLDEMIQNREVTDFSPAAEEATSTAVAEALRSTSRINERLGAFYSTERVRTKLGGISRQAVSERVRRHRLLRVETSDGRFLFPSFQIVNGEVPKKVGELLQILLGTGADGWTVAYWLTARLPQFEGKTALEVLTAGDPNKVALLKDLAAEDAAGWASAGATAST